MQTHQLWPLEEGMEPTMPFPGYCAFKFKKPIPPKPSRQDKFNLLCVSSIIYGGEIIPEE